jgi:hypothetical protein
MATLSAPEAAAPAAAAPEAEAAPAAATEEERAVPPVGVALALAPDPKSVGARLWLEAAMKAAGMPR